MKLSQAQIDNVQQSWSQMSYAYHKGNHRGLNFKARQDNAIETELKSKFFFHFHYITSSTFF